MSIQNTLNEIIRLGIVPCWRHDDTGGIIDACKALCDIGMNTVELTMTTPGNIRLIERAVNELPAGVIVGAGTVLDAETARMAILAGANYIVSPALVPELVPLCHRYQVAVIMGVFSPTEILTAKSLGVDMLKIFPASVGGPSNLAEMRAVFPGILTAVGGMPINEIPGFIAAGADCAVVGLPKIALSAYENRSYKEMQQQIQSMVDTVVRSRSIQARQRFGEDMLKRYLEPDVLNNKSKTSAL